jgi:ATP/maltotriose-dependent transcriptional regulator MalT
MKNNQMSEAARRKAREYQRLWRQRNPDKVRQYNINYWERKANEDNIPSLETRVNDLKKQGLSLRDIGKKLNISHMKVKRLLQACNTL